MLIICKLRCVSDKRASNLRFKDWTFLKERTLSGKNNIGNRRPGVYRVQFYPPVPSGTPGGPGGQSGQADLFRQPGEPPGPSSEPWYQFVEGDILDEALLGDLLDPGPDPVGRPFRRRIARGPVHPADRRNSFKPMSWGPIPCWKFSSATGRKNWSKRPISGSCTYPPMKSTGPWGPRGFSPRKPLSGPTHPTRPARPPGISWPGPTLKPSAFRS